MSNNKEKEILIQDIYEMKSASFDQMAKITFYSLANYFKSLATFGTKSEVTQDNINIIKEMYRILRQERFLLNYILRNVDKVDTESALNMVAILDELNDKTVMYYINVIDEIEEACETKTERRGKRPPKAFPTLIEDNSYIAKVLALKDKFPEIKSLLNYEQEFWNFIEPLIRSCYLPNSLLGKVPIVKEIHDENDLITSIMILVPEIVDYETALINLELFEKAYNIYKSIGKSQIEQHSSIDIEKAYQTDCLKRNYCI